MPNKFIRANDGSLIGNSFFTVGSIQQTFLSASEFESIMGTDWVLADGRDVTGSSYETITGNSSVPDCRGLFLRTVGGNANATIGGTQSDTTAQNGLSASTNSAGSHTHSYNSRLSPSAFGAFGNPGGITNTGSATTFATNSAGSHSHTVSLSGDTETRPVNITVNTFVKIN